MKENHTSTSTTTNSEEPFIFADIVTKNKWFESSVLGLIEIG